MNNHKTSPSVPSELQRELEIAFFTGASCWVISFPQPKINRMALPINPIAQSATVSPKAVPSPYRFASGNETSEEMKAAVLPETKPSASDIPMCPEGERRETRVS